MIEFKLDRFINYIKYNNLVNLIEDVNNLIAMFESRSKDRLFRKLVEECGEFAECIELDNGAKRKVEKYKGKDPKKMLQEEIADVVMCGLGLAKKEGMNIQDVLETIKRKLEKKKIRDGE